MTSTPERFSALNNTLGKAFNPSICDKFFGDQLGVKINDQIAKIAIIIINVILRTIIIKLIIGIGKDTLSEQTRLIANGVFIVQFFNTALLLLLVNANLEEQGFPLKLLSAERGLSDFNSSWFSDIGVTLTGAMLFNVYWPIIEFFVFGGMRQAFRCLDRGFSSQEVKVNSENF